MGLWTARQIFGKSFADAGELEEHWVTFLRDSRGGLAPQRYPQAVEAHVNHGRWIAECPHCKGGIACPPHEWPSPEGCCLTCGHVYPVAWPDAFEQIEVLLANRGQDNQNWELGEEVAQLERENTLMGVT